MNLNEIKETYSEYYMNCFYPRADVAFESGKGIHLYDTEGNEYTDFFAGIAVNALGYSHPALVKAITEQAAKLIHCSNLYYIESQTKLAELLCKNSCASRAFICNSGAEANEAAIKLARGYFKKFGAPQKYGFITLKNSFHGRTLTTATATGQEKYSKPFAPLTEGFKHVEINDFDALLNAVDEHTCAILLEPVQGESGVYPLDAGYVEKVRKLCDEKNLFLIFDEVQTGLGRTGKMFGYELYGVEPDIFTLAKALGGGVPIGAMCAKSEAAKGFEPGDHGTTFGGNPLACTAALASLGTIISDDLPGNAAKVGKYFENSLVSLAAKFTGTNAAIHDVRAVGLMIGLEFNSPIAANVKSSLFESKWLVGCVGNTLRILPPLIITENDVDNFVHILSLILSKY
ncbi:MAG: aspartate aminotransferase family protein [Clostridiales bacterium]|jgi:predicted acetylornithine/succinylornithine family transaminase|nr:aspartate aminotransferase family protein [Clostridiales bacterium]